MTPETAFSIGGIVAGLAIALGTAYAVLRSQTVKTDLELMKASNAELRSQRTELKGQVDELQGQVNVLKGRLVDDLARSMRRELKDLILELRKGDER